MTIATIMSPRRVRLISGLVMFAYLTEHLLNHALGIISLPLAESGLQLGIAFWRNPVATALLYGAAAVHFALALWTLSTRHEWRLPWVEIVRLFAGFTFPLLLFGHAVSSRLGTTLFDVEPTYASTIANLQAAGTQGLQLALLAPGWLHGCLGLWISLRRFDFMQRLKPLLIALVGLVPLLAALGFLSMSADVSILPPPAPMSQEKIAQVVELGDWKDILTRTYLALIAAAFMVGRFRAMWMRRLR